MPDVLAQGTDSTQINSATQGLDWLPRCQRRRRGVPKTLLVLLLLVPSCGWSNEGCNTPRCRHLDTGIEQLFNLNVMHRTRSSRARMNPTGMNTMSDLHDLTA